MIKNSNLDEIFLASKIQFFNHESTFQNLKTPYDLINDKKF